MVSDTSVEPSSNASPVTAPVRARVRGWLQRSAVAALPETLARRVPPVPENTFGVTSAASGTNLKSPAAPSKPKKPSFGPVPSCQRKATPRSMASRAVGGVSPPRNRVGSSSDTLALLTVVVVPLTTRAPLTISVPGRMTLPPASKRAATGADPPPERTTRSVSAAVSRDQPGSFGSATLCPGKASRSAPVARAAPPPATIRAPPRLAPPTTESAATGSELVMATALVVVEPRSVVSCKPSEAVAGAPVSTRPFASTTTER